MDRYPATTDRRTKRALDRTVCPKRASVKWAPDVAVPATPAVTSPGTIVGTLAAGSAVQKPWASVSQMAMPTDRAVAPVSAVRLPRDKQPRRAPQPVWPDAVLYSRRNCAST